MTRSRTTNIFLTGLAYYLYTYITMHRFTNMSMLLLMSSIIIFMLGLVSEQISQIRMDRTEPSAMEKEIRN